MWKSSMSAQRKDLSSGPIVLTQASWLISQQPTPVYNTVWNSQIPLVNMWLCILQLWPQSYIPSIFCWSERKIVGFLWAYLELLMGPFTQVFAAFRDPPELVSGPWFHLSAFYNFHLLEPNRGWHKLYPVTNFRSNAWISSTSVASAPPI